MTSPIDGWPTVFVQSGTGTTWQNPSDITREDQIRALTATSRGLDYHKLDQTDSSGLASSGGGRAVDFSGAIGGDDMIIFAFYMHVTNGITNIEDFTIAAVELRDLSGGEGGQPQTYSILEDKFTHHDDPVENGGLRFFLGVIINPTLTGSQIELTVENSIPGTAQVWMVAHTVAKRGSVRVPTDIESVSAVTTAAELAPSLALTPALPLANHIAGARLAEWDPGLGKTTGLVSTANTDWAERFDQVGQVSGEGYAVAHHEISNLSGEKIASWTCSDPVWACMWHIAIPTGFADTRIIDCTNVPEFAGVGGKALEGVEVYVRGHLFGSGNADDSAYETIQLINSGGANGTNHALTPIAMTAGPPDVTTTVGGAADLWAMTPTLNNTEIAATTFGVRLKCGYQGSTIDEFDHIAVDDVMIKAYFVTGGGGEPDLELYDSTGKFLIAHNSTYPLGSGFYRCEGALNTITIIARNVGDATLNVGAITIGAGMQIVSSPASSTILAGAEAEIVINATSSPDCGGISALLTVNSDDPDPAAYLVTLTANVVSRNWFDWRSFCPTRKYRMRCNK